jgi:hypothetical protein
MFIYPYLVWYSITVDDIRDDLQGLHHTLYNTVKTVPVLRYFGDVMRTL